MQPLDSLPVPIRKDKTGNTRSDEESVLKKYRLPAKARVQAKIVRVPSIVRVTRECEVIYEQ